MKVLQFLRLFAVFVGFASFTPYVLAVESLPKMDTIVLASNNEDKIKEIKKALRSSKIKLVTAEELEIDLPVKTENTFEGNAAAKAIAAAKAAQLPALAEESGLCINVLNGRPGAQISRYFDPKNTSYAKIFKRIKREIGKNPDHSAYFQCCLVLAFPDGSNHTYSGRVDGKVVFPPRGDKGFGYDPIFVPEGYEKTFGEMGQQRRSKINHRAKALKILQEALQTPSSPSTLPSSSGKKHPLEPRG
jgi:XTP/dITP diphosphohydrolase